VFAAAIARDFVLAAFEIDNFDRRAAAAEDQVFVSFAVSADDVAGSRGGEGRAGLLDLDPRFAGKDDFVGEHFVRVAFEQDAAERGREDYVGGDHVPDRWGQPQGVDAGAASLDEVFD